MNKKSVTRLVDVIFLTVYILIILYFGFPIISRVQSQKVFAQSGMEIISHK